ncbi:hypothetical protein JCM6882_002746 [Rhodosporidiobolus microsporus]
MAAPARLLTNLSSTADPSLSRYAGDDNGGGSGSDSGSAPATPSKDKMREWTFPRSSSSSAGSGTTSSARPLPPSIDVSSSSSSSFAHGRSSSIAPSASPSSTTKSPPGSSTDPARRPLLHHNPSSSSAAHGTGSRDFRHRTNASLAFAASATPEIGSSPRGGFSQLPSYPSSSPTASSHPSHAAGAPEKASPDAAGMAKMVYSNVRRRGLNDIVYLVIFGGAFVVFFGALLGVGYDGAGPTSSSYPASSPRVVGGELARQAEGEVVDVKIPSSFLRPEDLEGEHVPADVHQPYGDVSHEEGEMEHFGDSPGEWEGVVGDGEVHAHPDPAARPASDPALFPDPDAALSPDMEHASEDALLLEHEEAVRRPRPERLGRVAELEGDEEGEEVEPSETEEEEEVDTISSEDDDDDATPDEVEEEEEDALVDDSISLSNPAVHADGSLHMLADDDLAAEAELSALEELLDAGLAEEEEQEGILGAAGAGAGAARGEGREELERLERARAGRRPVVAPAAAEEEGAGEAVGAGAVGKRRMVRRLR